jgi:hypothetical protein
MAKQTTTYITRQGVSLAINFDEAQVPDYTLPDPLLFAGGAPVGSAEAWQQRRRPEVLELFREHVYGLSPAATGAIAFDLIEAETPALAGPAVRRQVRIFPLGRGVSLWLDLLLYLPQPRPGPVPLFLAMNFFGNHTVQPDPAIILSEQWMMESDRHGIQNHRAGEAGRGTSASRWPVAHIVARGYGLATFYYGDLVPDDPELGQAQLPRFFPAGTPAERQSALSVWAWGLSRALDYLATDPTIDRRRVAVLGHSRLGKAALWAGAQDERLALVISNNSGCGGAALSRRRFGETVEAINTAFPHWFGHNFKRYNNNEASLPLDQHMLLALIAPRPLYLASASEDLWADPAGEFLAAKAATPVYHLLGQEGLVVAAMPPVGRPVLSRIGYHLRAGEHDLTAYDWARFLDFADKHLDPGG